MEDLLDTWPGTLVVISHDRYLLERVTDNQYAILDGRLRHLPGGVDEYLRVRGGRTTGPTATLTSQVAAPPSSGPGEPGLGGAEARAARKQLAAVERKMDKLATQANDLHEAMTAHDAADYEGLAELSDRLRAVETQTAELEERWLELTDLIG